LNQADKDLLLSYEKASKNSDSQEKNLLKKQIDEIITTKTKQVIDLKAK
jgi:hypothetical protein